MALETAGVFYQNNSVAFEGDWQMNVGGNRRLHRNLLARSKNRIGCAERSAVLAAVRDRHGVKCR